VPTPFTFVAFLRARFGGLTSLPSPLPAVSAEIGEKVFMRPGSVPGRMARLLLKQMLKEKRRFLCVQS